MDHIPLPSDPLYQPVVVPCLDPTPYEGNDFDAYPSRQGWDKTRLFAGDFSQHPADRTAAFLQNWLYFGVLSEVLGDLGSKANYSQPWPPLENGRVATQHLDDHLSSCMDNLIQIWKVGPQASQRRLYKLERMLKQVSLFCCRMTVPEETDWAGRHTWPLPSEVDFSIRVLGSYMSAGIYEALWHVVPDSFFANLKFGAGYLPKSRMMTAGWCPSDISMALEQFSPASLHYVSMLRRNTVRDHSNCSSEACLASQVNEASYITKHAVANCDCPHIGPPVEDIVAIIESGRIPLLTVTRKKNGTLLIDVEAHKPGRRYVAFSHVWSDGMGNPSHNTLPKCQLERVNSLLNELDRLSSTWSLVNRGHADRLWGRFAASSSRFWIDTLCVPVSSSYASQRSRAISMMKGTYENAYQVLVLDSELEALPIHDFSEAMMRVSLSGWMRRLWTLQEGVLAKRLYVKFKDGILDVKAANGALMSPRDDKGVASKVKATYGTVPNNASQFHFHMTSMRRNIVDAPEPKLVGVRTVISFNDDEEVKKTRKGHAIMEAFIASRYRTTSRQSDEYICLASLLDWDTSALSSVPMSQRMKLLLSTQDKLPQGILFSPGPRMEQPGWGWAVTRFGNPGWKYHLDAQVNDITLADRGEAGLTVQYPGIVLPLGYQQSGLIEYVDVLVDGEKGTQTLSFELGLFELGEVGISVRNDECHCVLFYAINGAMRAGAAMAAAVVSVPGECRPLISTSSKRILCTFIALCRLRLLDKDFESSRTLVSPTSTPHPHTEHAFLIDRKWTIK
ncbi:hypothetical protein F5Y04DRAFT_194439 [Hypomontagnella monticulosa]|nr:hypothetical protein F5Y04DRAFT_194439 [Hypomontagnella monticulosa]